MFDTCALGEAGVVNNYGWIVCGLGGLLKKRIESSGCIVHCITD